MTTETRIQKLLAADIDTLARLDAVLEGRRETPKPPTDHRLLTLTQAAAALNVSRMTVFRMLRDKRLPCVETRAGRRRIPAAALSKLTTISE